MLRFLPQWQAINQEVIAKVKRALSTHEPWRVLANTHTYSQTQIWIDLYGVQVIAEARQQVLSLPREEGNPGSPKASPNSKLNPEPNRPQPEATAKAESVRPKRSLINYELELSVCFECRQPCHLPLATCSGQTCNRREAAGILQLAAARCAALYKFLRLQSSRRDLLRLAATRRDSTR